MRKWWKDTNDPSGSFHSAVKEESAIQFQFATTEGLRYSREVFREPPSLCCCKPTSCPWTPSALGGPAKTLSWTLSSKSHEAWGNKQKGQVPDTVVGQGKLCGLYHVDLQCSADETVIFVWKIACKWFWASILKNGVDFFYCPCLSNDMESGGSTSALSLYKEGGAKVCTDHQSIVGVYTCLTVPGICAWWEPSCVCDLQYVVWNTQKHACAKLCLK